MAALVEPTEMISTIISHWLSTMSYLSAPDKRPMIEIVSHCQTNGVSIQSIKGKVASSSYRSLEEFVSEFVMLIEFEREDLNSNMNPDIKTAQGGLKSVSESSKSQIYKAYGIFILEQYLEDWKSKTLDKVNNKTVTIDELYEMLERKKIRNSLLKSTKSTKTLPEEHPKRVSKRISAAQKKNKDLTLEKIEVSHSQAETEETPQPCCSYNPEQSSENYESSDEDRDFPVDSLEVDTLGINRNSHSSDLFKIPANTLDFKSDDILIQTNEQDFLGETSVEIFASVNDEFLETDTGNHGNESATNLSPQLEMSEAKKIKRCKSEPIRTTKFLSQLSSQGSVHKQESSYHTEDPFDTNDEIASINLDEINISDEKQHNQTTGVISARLMAPKRKRRVYFYESKKWRKERRLAWKSGGDSKNKKFKLAELNVNTNNNNSQDVLGLSKEELSDVASNGDNVDIDDKINTNNDNNNNNNNNSSDISESSELTLTGATTPPQRDPRSTKQKFSPIVYDLTPSPTPVKLNPYRCPATVPIATRPPAPLHGPYFVTPGVSANQYFPRYPYTTYPPTQHTPIQRFYARQRIPSIAIMGRPFPTQIRYRQQMFTPNSAFKAYPH